MSSLWQNYHLPGSLDEALDLLTAYNGRARIVAGGTDLILEIRQGRRPPVEALVDITRVEGLGEISLRDGWITIGAAVTHARIVESALLRERATALVEACGVIGGPQVLAWAACEFLGASQDDLVFRDGRIYPSSVGNQSSGSGDCIGGRSVSIAQAAQWALEGGRRPIARHVYEAPATQPLGEAGDMHFAYSFGVQAALVEVDTETGQVEVLKVAGAHDVGRAINITGLVGQIRGGIIMGLGNALTEEYPIEDGWPWCDTFSKYKMLGIRHTPEIICHVVENPVAAGPYGAKGVGELASIPTTPAITNAIYHAVGVRVTRLPVDQDWLLRELKKKGVTKYLSEKSLKADLSPPLD